MFPGGGKQIKDQEFVEGNLVLKLSLENKLSVRVTKRLRRYFLWELE